MTDYREAIHVPGGKYARVAYSHDEVHQILTTEGAGPCHLIGIINVKKQIAYLGHFDSGGNFAEDIIQLAVGETEGDLSSLRIALAGNGILNDVDRANEQEYLLALVETAGIQRRYLQNKLASKEEVNGFTHGMEVDPVKKKAEIWLTPIE